MLLRESTARTTESAAVTWRGFGRSCVRRCAPVLFALWSVAIAQANPSPLWINDVVREVMVELGISGATEITTIVGERLLSMARSNQDADKRFYLDHLSGEGNDIERWGAFRTRLADAGYVMLLEARDGYLVLPHSGKRFDFAAHGGGAERSFELLFGHPVPPNAAPWVIDDRTFDLGAGGRSGWGWYSDAAINLNGRLRLTLDHRCTIPPQTKLAMIAINEATHTVLFRRFGFGRQNQYDWQKFSRALEGTPVSREGEINEFLSDVASVNTSDCAFSLVYDHLLDRYLYGTEDDHHLSGRFFRSRVSRWESHTGSNSPGEFERRLGKILTADTIKAREEAVVAANDYLMDEIYSEEFCKYVQAEYMTAGRRVLSLLRQ